MQKWKMFHPPGKENQLGKVRRRGKEKTVGVAVRIIFMIFFIKGLTCLKKKKNPFVFLLVASFPHPLEVKYFWAVV